MQKKSPLTKKLSPCSKKNFPHAKPSPQSCAWPWDVLTQQEGTSSQTKPKVLSLLDDV